MAPGCVVGHPEIGNVTRRSRLRSRPTGNQTYQAQSAGGELPVPAGASFITEIRRAQFRARRVSVQNRG
jgi:hypothetical protein